MTCRPQPLFLLLLAACVQPTSGPHLSGPCADPARRPEALIVAGSGSNLALARRIGASFGAVVPPSIGTAGAIQALLDGEIDVGLASRPLSAAEEDRGVRTVPWARCPFGPVARRGERTDLHGGQLAAMLAGEGDSLVFLREPGDSGQALLRTWSPAVAAALDEALRRDRWPVLTTDQQMRDAVAANPGAIGFLDSSTVTPDLTLLAGSPLHKELSLLLPPSAPPRAKEFAQYATSPAAAPLIEAAGCQPR